MSMVTAAKNAATKLAPLFKPSKRGDKLRVGYIYSDGVVVVKFEGRRDVGDVEYCKVGRLPSAIGCLFKGRIVLHDYRGLPMFRAALAAGLHSISATAPGLDHGSEATRKAGLAIGYVTFETSVGEVGEIIFPLISGGCTYDADQMSIGADGAHLGFADLVERERWAGYHVVQFIDCRAEDTAA